MRLIDVFEPEYYQPIGRGIAFPQFYENGDCYQHRNPFDFNFYFWNNACWATDDAAGIAVGYSSNNKPNPIFFMGEEL